MEERKARFYGWSVVFASWLAVFCLFGLEFLLSTLKAPEPRRGGDAPRGWGERINDWLAGAVGMQEADGAEPGAP